MSAGKTCVILVGGWHPFHAGHAALYQAAKKTFPNSDVWVGENGQAHCGAIGC